MEELISGGMVKSHLDALRDRLGAAAYDSATASLAEDIRSELLVDHPACCCGGTSGDLDPALCKGIVPVPPD